MTLATYTPFDTQIDRLFNDTIRAFGRDVHSWVPAGNAWEDSNTFGIELALPGWKTDQVNIQVDKGVLTVEGKHEDVKAKEEKTDRKYHVREVENTSFKRTFRLPTNLQWDKANATFTDGVLTIEFPKREEAKPRQIAIR